MLILIRVYFVCKGILILRKHAFVLMKKCPACKSKSIAQYVYGYGFYLYSLRDKETQKKIEEGKIILGGCSMYPNLEPEWKCNDCGLTTRPLYQMERCPSCKSENYTEYFYDFSNDKWEEKGERKKGITKYNKWACNDCDRTWGPINKITDKIKKEFAPQKSKD